jgi:hypothetical protein
VPIEHKQQNGVGLSNVHIASGMRCHLTTIFALPSVFTPRKSAYNSKTVAYKERLFTEH